MSLWSKWILGTVYMVSGSRDNPSPELPWARYFPTHLFKKLYQPLTWGGWDNSGGRDNSGRRVVSPRQVGFFACKQFCSPTRDETVGPELSLLRFRFALQTNSLRFNVAWAVKNSCRVFKCKSSAIKIWTAIDNTALKLESRNTIFVVSLFLWSTILLKI